MDRIPMIWMGLLVLFLVVEAACPVHLVSIWFAAGSLAALVVYWFAGPLWLQITLFVVVSAGLLLLLWPLTRKYMNPAVTPTNVDSIIGKVGLVSALIDNLDAVGKVKLGGMEWTARSESGDPIPAGTKVTVQRIEGVKVFVTPVEVAAEVK